MILSWTTTYINSQEYRENHDGDWNRMKDIFFIISKQIRKHIGTRKKRDDSAILDICLKYQKILKSFPMVGLLCKAWLSKNVTKK